MSEASAQPKERVVRVFISSTFRDMNAEREELGKFIFPELRRFCREREVEFVEVDLRWGVTEEQSQRGETLAVCLAEIDHCRPYFIGLLGERYGWVPGEFRKDVVDGNRWLAELSDRSVTELEILHGVLNNPAMSDRAAFYFRDPHYPHYLDGIQAEQRPDFTSENEQAAQKLAALKQRIRQSGLPLTENYADPHSVAPQIGADLRRAIEAEFPTGEVRDRLAEEAAGHEIYAQSRARVYTGREADLTRIDAFVTGAPVEARPIGQPSGSQNRLAPSQPPPAKKPAGLLASLKQRFSSLGPAASAPIPSPHRPAKQERAEGTLKPLAPDGGREEGVLVILGPSGCGKSALLANWALRWRSTHAHEYVFLHFLGSTPGSADYTSLLRRLLQELKARFEISQDLPDTPEALRNALPNWLAMAAAKCPRLVLVLDGLNQVEDRDQGPDLVWLPQQFPANVRVLVSTLPGRCLEALRKRPHVELEVQLLTQEERLRLVDAYLGRYKKHLEERRARWIASTEAAASPLYLRVLLEELRQFGSYELLDARIEHYLQARTIDDLYEKVLERLENDYERERPGLVKEALSLVWAARRGLSESELLELLGNVPRAVWSPLYLALEEALVERGGVIDFFHDFLRQAVHDRYLPEAGEQREVRLRLADYFQRRGLDGRQVDELPWLLAQVSEWQRLYERLADLDFFAAAWTNDPYEVETYWAQVEANSSLRKVEAYRSMLESSQKYQGGLLWPLACLLKDTGSPQEALKLFSHLVDHFRQIGDNNSLAMSLSGKALILKDLGDLEGAMALLKEQERICRRLGNLDGLSISLGNQALILRTRGDLDSAMALLKEQERICRQLGNLDGLSISLGNQALILKARGDLDGAMALHKEEERICRQSGSLVGLQACLDNQALILQARGDLDEGMALHKEEERICRQLGNLDGLQRSLGNQALILEARGDLDGAMALHKEKERICRQVGNLDSLQACLGNQAVILKNRSDLDGAMALHREEELICRQLGNLNGLQACFGNQAVILKARGDLDGAMALYREEERICRQLGSLDGLSTSLGDQAVILQTYGDLDGAMALYREEERICRQLGSNLNGLQRSLGNQAVILQVRGDQSGAMALLKEQEQYCRQLGSLDGLSISLGNQAVILKARGDLDGAMALHKEEELICRKLSNMEGLAISLINQSMILNKQGKRSQALQTARQALELARQSGYSGLAQKMERTTRQMGG